VFYQSNRADWESGRGAKFKMHPMAAALGLASLRQLPEINKARLARINILAEEVGADMGAHILQGLPGRTGYYGAKLLIDSAGQEHVGHILEDLLRACISAKMLDVRPLHRLSLFRIHPDVRLSPEGYPKADTFFARCLSLPHVIEAEDRLVRYYGRTIRRVLSSYDGQPVR
jgi:dTDP-4-amino-4,6-dideoxygalactose transaminase